MDNETDKLIQEQFGKLPENLQTAIKTVPWKNLAQEIGRANGLDADEIATLEQETMFIVYGFEPAEDYPDNLVKTLGIEEDKALDIAESVLEKIFKPISEKAGGSNASIPSNLPTGQGAHISPTSGREVEIAPENHPAERKEMEVSLPDYRYPDGQDPYREPIK